MKLLDAFLHRRSRIPEDAKTDMDRRRDLAAPEHNPGFCLKARRETARLVGVRLPDA